MTLRSCQQFALSFSKVTVVCAATLCFAFTPAAFAQRGGHVGGGHVGHFGGFGGHAGMRGAARGSRGAGAAGRAFRPGSAGRAVNAPRSAYEIAAMQSRSGASTRGYSREVFVSASGERQFAPPSTRFVGANGQTSAIGSHAFAANNFFWEAPPQQRTTTPAQMPRPVMPPNQMQRPIMMPTPRPLNLPANPLARPMVSRPIFMPLVRNPVRTPMTHGNPMLLPPIRGAVNRPLARPLALPMSTSRTTPLLGMTAQPTPFFFPRFTPFHPFRPIGGIFPRSCAGMIGNCDFLFGFGFGSPFFFTPGFGCFGFFNPCGIGFGPFGFGTAGFGPFGFGDAFLGQGFGNGWFYPPAPEIPPPPVNPAESNPPLDYSPGYFYVPQVPYAESSSAPQQQTVKLALKDGTIFEVYSYWLQDNRLFYVTTYNIKTSIPVDDLDLQKTVDLNQKLGVTFTLSNKPPDQQQPPDQQPPDGSDNR